MMLTGSAILRLIVDEVGRHYPELLPPGVVKPDYVRSAVAPDKLKQHVLDATYEAQGPAAILRIGQGLERAGYTPIWHLMLSAQGPISMLGKWFGLEESAAARFRIDYKPHPSGMAVDVRHYTLFGPPSRVTESLLICGVHLSIFKRLGCTGLRCFLTPENAAEIPLFDNGDMVAGHEKLDVSAGRWRVEWSGFEPAAARHGQPSSITPALPLLADYDDPTDVIHPALSIIGQDLSCNWKVEDLALRLRMSRRSLQRHLQQSQASFSLLVRAARVREASKLLSGTPAPITDIGYRCGFSDSAHFARDFRKSVGVSPSAYRRLALIA